MDSSLPGSSVHGILQARILEWAAVSFSRGSSRPRDGAQADALPPEPAGKPQVREGERNVDKILEVLTTNEKPDKFYSISIKKFCLLTL